MPSATPQESPATLASGKKRRRDDEFDAQNSIYEHFIPSHHAEGPGVPRSATFPSDAFTAGALTAPRDYSTQNLLAAIDNNRRLLISPHDGSGNGSLLGGPRKIIPLPKGKRLRLSDDNDLASTHPYQIMSPSTPQEYTSHSHAHPTPPMSPQLGSKPGLSRTSSHGLLAPCHICHRKPRQKSDLDSFADCEGCGQRTCFVCVRACQGWLPDTNSRSRRPERTMDEAETEDLSASFTMRDVDDETGEAKAREESQQRTSNTTRTQSRGGDGWSGVGHREMICSRCCVERGLEGDVVCLGCLAGMEGA